MVRELEGLGPGSGMFARDRAYQKSLQEAREGKTSVEKKKESRKPAAPNEELDSDTSDEESEEDKRVLESGGRDRCAYFFWQGNSLFGVGVLSSEYNDYTEKDSKTVG